MSVQVDRVRKIEPWKNNRLTPGTRSYKGLCGWGGNCDEKAVYLIWYEEREGYWAGTAACEAHGRPVVDAVTDLVVSDE